MSESSNTDKDNTPKYQGNEIPLAIKIVWTVFFIWLVYYLISYSIPNLAEWLGK